MQGWISPQGKFWPCDYGGHWNEAVTIIKCYGYPIGENEDPERFLELHGWLHLWSSGFFEVKRLTKAQQSTLLDLQGGNDYAPWVQENNDTIKAHLEVQ